MNYEIIKQNLLNYNKEALVEMLIEAYESDSSEIYLDELFTSLDEMSNEIEWNDDGDPYDD